MSALREILLYKKNVLLHPENSTKESRDELGKSVLNSPEGLAAVNSLFEFEISNSAIERIADSINNGGDCTIASTHGSHVGGIALASVCGMVTREVRRQRTINPEMNLPPFKGFYLLIADSLKNGLQGGTRKAMYDLIVNHFNQQEVEPLTVVNEYDIARYNSTSNPAAILKLFRAHKDGYGDASFPNGTTDFGRLKKEMNIYGEEEVKMPPQVNGLAPPLPGFARSLAVKIKAGNLTFLPVAIINDNSIFNPDKYEITKEGIDATVHNLFFPFLPKRMARVIISNPIIFKELPEQIQGMLSDAAINRNYQVIEDYFMVQIANDLPPELWGTYTSEMVKLYHENS